MRRKKNRVQPEAELYDYVVTGGPKKYYNRRKVRKPFVKRLDEYRYEPITAEWYQSFLTGIIAARHRKKLSQLALAELLRTSQSAISQLETGKTNPTAELLNRIFTLLDISIEITFK